MERSRGMRWIWMCLASFVVSAVPAQAVTVGAMGDSLTDEYVGGPGELGATNLPALNWVQLLAEYRGVDFGTWAESSDGRGEPRNGGYAHNWARSGGTALASPLGFTLSTQVAGLTPAVASGEVDTVFVGIGSNDFFFREFADKAPMSGPEFEVFRDALIDSILQGALTLDAAGSPNILISMIPEGTAGGQTPATVAAIRETNALLGPAALALGFHTFDLFGFTDDPSRFAEDGDLLVGGLRIDSQTNATLGETVALAGQGRGAPCDSEQRCASLEYALHVIASDTIHPGTIMQGLMANEFLGALNATLDTPIPLLSDSEIIGAAVVPEPGTALLLAVGLLGLARPSRSRPMS